MWQVIRAPNALPQDDNKWVKVNEVGRIVGRVHLKEGEFKASKLHFDADGVGNKNYLGSFFTLDQAKAAIDGPAV